MERGSFATNRAHVLGWKEVKHEEVKRRRTPDPECEEYVQIQANDTLHTVREKQGRR